jgi:uncharacterized membrane protein HdeD (DUF308 family)
MADAMRSFFTAIWRTVLLRGLASLVFGILAFVYPNITLTLIVTLFGVYALVDGLLGLWGVFGGRGEGKSVPSLLTALASVAAGFFCLLLPGPAAAYVVLLIGLWNVAAGLLQVIGAIVLRNEIAHAGLMALAGVVGAALGVLIMFYPNDAAVSIIWIIAATALVVGLVLCVFALKLRSAGKFLKG